ncbi:zinc transporter [Defluviimonas sp. 20V17]|uniref:Zinc import ATP-binding protein ZnuC n=1 Tax=Allgaiera indica TaxID=765699 RepID=A0AAN4UT45_9RHOB|nr:metal ABC transporter ATP-binding protein [Allgaiera indica]KDB05536.1 zinc transporter [Defluviimonas sp. 20V17]GHE03555.1 zinc import ATP-binding protein ZnuC [Allgaiera indica]SDX43960.1 zinc transport system ATP-binding protein [Allgaiera indica]
MTLIEARDLTVRLGGATVLEGVDLALEPGEIVTIVGPNGSGKSTLLRALLGIQPLASGRVTRKPGLRLGYVPQRLHIDAGLPLTVRRFLSLPRRHGAADTAAVLARVSMAGMEERQMLGLSGGQLQRVLLARALLARPDILVLDEPTQGLDQPGEAAFYELIEEVRAEFGCAILMVSHDLHVVMSASDRVICLNGHVCCQGTPHVVSNAPEYRALFGLGTRGTLALYQHDHDHHHDHDHDHDRGPAAAPAKMSEADHV